MNSGNKKKSVKRKNVYLLAIIMASFLILSGFSVEGFLFRRTVKDVPSNIGQEACEADRSCCVTQGINKICQRSDINPDFANPFQWKDLQLQDTYEANVWHYPGSLYANGNPDGYPAKGGIGRVSIAPYGWLFSGPSIGSGGINRFVWTPTKVMEFGETWSNLASQYESELTSDRYNVASKLFVTARATGNLGVSVQMINGGQGAIWRNNINGNYCGFQERYTVSGGAAYPAWDKDMLFVMYPCPTSYNAATRTFYFSMTTGETKEITMLVTDKTHETGVNDWMVNYYTKEKAIRQEYETWARAIVYPTGASQAEKKTYYLTDYSSWFNRMNAFDDLNSGNFKGKQILTPNFNGYYGMWEHDSYWLALGDLQVASNNVRLDKLKDAITVWRTAPANVMTIYQNSYNTGDEGYQGGWALASWILYKQTGDKTFLCDSEPWLKSQYTTQRSNCPNNYCNGANLGRDGTNADTKIAMTNWYLLNSIVMSKIETECSNSLLANEYLQNFESAKTELNKYWKTNLNFYSTRVDYIDTNPLTCWSLGLDAIPEDKIQAYVDTLLTKFVDQSGLTSIAKDHPCYSATGADNSCAGGETWDGPVWAGIDNTICIWALRQQVNVYKRTQFTDELNQLILTAKKVSQQSKLGAESYSANGIGVGSWGSRPYAWGNLVGSVPIINSNPLALLGLRADACTPTTEICDNKDNDCDNLIDENVKISCTNYANCTSYDSCAACPAVPTETCDGIDNDCDGNIDTGCGCVSGQTKQCGTTDIGECAYGTQTCSAGQWQLCNGDVGPVQEIKDSKDNDCDGSIDEDTGGQCQDPWDPSVYKSWEPKRIIDFIVMLLNVLKGMIGA